MLGYFCVNCHATPPCEQACDGFWFNNWAELATGGNHGLGDAPRVLQRVVDRMGDAGMPPEGALVTRPLPDAPRQLMIEFIEEFLNRTR